MSTVTCRSCTTVFPEIEPGFAMFEQAEGCASIVRRKKLTGHYGSKVIDMQRWHFRERPAWVRDGVICDECLRRLLAEDAIAFIERTW